MEISVIGAGPVGCYTAALVAKHYDVNIFEEHSEIGKPVQCTGLTTPTLLKLVRVPNQIIINRIQYVRIFSPRRFIELKLKEKNLVVDRMGFDSFLADLAVNRGAKLYLAHKFLRISQNKILIKSDKKTKNIKSDILIGADGPLSRVASCINLVKRKFLIGVQVRAKLKNDNTIEFYPHIGAFAWLVPEDNNIVRIGVAAYKNPKKILNNFLKEKQVKVILEYQAGLIPIYNPKQILQKNFIYLVGDAATQVKATTGGGLVPGLIGARILSSTINKDYQKATKKLRRELWLHLKLRQLMDKFSLKDWDYLITIFSNNKNIRRLQNLNRDNLVSSIKLVIQPRLLYFLKFLFV